MTRGDVVSGSLSGSILIEPHTHHAYMRHRLARWREVSHCPAAHQRLAMRHVHGGLRDPHRQHALRFEGQHFTDDGRIARCFSFRADVPAQAQIDIRLGDAGCAQTLCGRENAPDLVERRIDESFRDDRRVLRDRHGRRTEDEKTHGQPNDGLHGGLESQGKLILADLVWALRSCLGALTAHGSAAVLDDTLVEQDIHPVYVSAAASSIGRVRTANEDAFATDDASGWWVIADGMGGYREGDVAARRVCGALRGLDANLPLEGVVDCIRERLGAVNSTLYEASVRALNPLMSGSTVVMLLARRTACAVLWAGDSRAYRLRHGQLACLTHDHTRAGELHLTPDADDHAITRAVGGEEILLLDVRRDTVRLGDRYLLCSDGLTRELNEERIAELLGAATVQTAAHVLIQATLDAGARDNVTVVVVEAT